MCLVTWCNCCRARPKMRSDAVPRMKQSDKWRLRMFEIQNVARSAQRELAPGNLFEYFNYAYSRFFEWRRTLDLNGNEEAIVCFKNSAKKNGISASSVGEGNDDEFARNAGGRVNGHWTLHSHFHVVSAVETIEYFFYSCDSVDVVGTHRWQVPVLKKQRRKWCVGGANRGIPLLAMEVHTDRMIKSRVKKKNAFWWRFSFSVVVAIIYFALKWRTFSSSSVRSLVLADWFSVQSDGCRRQKNIFYSSESIIWQRRWLFPRASGIGQVWKRVSTHQDCYNSEYVQSFLSSVIIDYNIFLSTYSIVRVVSDGLSRLSCKKSSVACFVALQYDEYWSKL